MVSEEQMDEVREDDRGAIVMLDRMGLEARYIQDGRFAILQ